MDCTYTNFFIPRRPIKLLLDPLLSCQRDECLYFLNRPRNSHFLVVKKRCARSKQLRSFKKKKLCSVLRWLDLNLAGLVSRVTSSMTQVVTILSGLSVISSVYTSHFGNGTACLEPQPRWYWKKCQVLYTAENPPKVSHAVPYCTVPCHAMPCSGKVPYYYYYYFFFTFFFTFFFFFVSL